MAQKTIDELVIKIHSDAQNAGTGIDKMISSLSRLQGALNGSGNLVAKLNDISTAMSKFNRTTNRLNKISVGTRGVETVSRFLVNTGAGLGDIQRSTANVDVSAKNLSKLTTQLSRLSKVIDEIHLDVNKVNQLASSIRTLGEASSSVSTSSQALSSLRTQINQLSNQVNKLGTGNTKAARTTGILTDKLASFLSKIFIAKQIGTYIGQSIEQGNNYVETMNLFSVSFGEFVGHVNEWADLISGKLGLDPAEMKRFAATYMDLARSLGVADKNAVTMSKNLTQLTYDIASLKNLDFETSFLKLRSGLAGEIEPLRAIGYDISNAALQTKLYEMGINRLVTSLSQADKATLRYIVLMEHSTTAQQDLGKTLMSPANALRILKSSFIQLSRAIGYVFIPVLQSILPVVKLVVDTLTWAAERLAVSLGFELPKYDETGLTNIGNELEDVGESADEANKKLKNFTLGFDELHVIDTTSGQSENGLVGNILDGIKLPEYDMLGKYAEQTSNALDRMKESFRRFAEAPATQLALNLLGGLWDILKKLGEWALDNPEALATTLFTLGIALAALSAIQFTGNTIKWIHDVGRAITALPTDFKNLVDAFKRNLGLMRKIVAVALIAYSAFRLVSLGMKIWNNEGKITVQDTKNGITDLGILVTGFALFLKKAALGVSGGLLIIFGLFFEEMNYAITTTGSLLGMTFAWAGNKIGKIWFNVGYTLGEFFLNLVEETKYLLTLAQNNTSIFFKNMQLFALKAFDNIVDNFAKLVKDLTGIEIDVSFSDDWVNGVQNEINALKLENEQAKKNLDYRKQLTKETKESMLSNVNDIYDNWLDGVMDKYNKQMLDAEKLVEEKYSDGFFKGLFGDYLGSDTVNKDKLLLDLNINKPEKIDTQKEDTTMSLGDLDKQAEELKTQLDTISKQDEENNVLTNETLDSLDTHTIDNLSKLDELKSTNELSNKLSETANQQASTGWSRIHEQMSNLWWKLDKVQRACENIRLNIIHNHYYGAEKRAIGGPVSSGDLFIANEAGPELVGKIGNTNVVANQDQMVAAIAGGVYNAMVSAMSQQKSRPIQVNSYLQVNKRTLATAVTEGAIDNGYDMGLGGINV